MKVRKTWFSYVIWAFATILTIALVITFSKSLGMVFQVPWFSYPGLYALMAVLIIVPGILCYLIHQFLPAMKKIELSKTARVCIHIISFLLMLTGFFALRFMVLQNITDVSYITNSPFFEAAKIGSEDIVMEGSSKNTFQVYISVVSSIFLFLGNKEVVLLFIQLFIQLIATIAIYIAGRNWLPGIFGVIPAWIVAIAPTYLDNFKEVDCRNLTFMMIALWLMLCSILCNGTKLHYGKLFVLGAFTGLLCDYWCAFLGFFIMALVIICEKSELTIKDKSKFASVFAASTIFMYSIPNIIWPNSHGIYAYLQMGLQNQFYVSMMSNAAWTVCFIMLVLIMGYVVSFWFDKEEMGHIFSIPFIAMGIFFVFSDAFLHAADLYMVLQVFLAFLIAETGRLTFTKKQQPVTEPIAVTENNELADLIENNEMAEEVIIRVSDIIANDNCETVLDKKAPIENVLPLPKKHVSKVVDYAFEPSEEEMHYDVELTEETSDYDI